MDKIVQYFFDYPLFFWALVLLAAAMLALGGVLLYLRLRAPQTGGGAKEESAPQGGHFKAPHGELHEEPYEPEPHDEKRKYARSPRQTAGRSYFLPIEAYLRLGRIASLPPMYLRSTSGMVTLPSALRWFSSRAMSMRGGATTVLLRVCAKALPFSVL